MNNNFYGLLLITFISYTSCQNQVQQIKEAEKTEAVVISEAATLAERLSDERDDLLAQADTSRLNSYLADIHTTISSGVTNTALNVDEPAVDFTLHNQEGQEVQLSELLKEGPVVLTWYRGGWSPFCNITLDYLQERSLQFDLARARLLAITPELPDSAQATSDRIGLDFDVLSDVGNKVARQYGLVFKLGKDTAQRYQSKFKMHDYNGDESDELPLAATYIIDTSGVIRYAFLEADFSKRAEPDDLLDVLYHLN